MASDARHRDGIRASRPSEVLARSPLRCPSDLFDVPGYRSTAADAVDSRCQLHRRAVSCMGAKMASGALPDRLAAKGTIIESLPFPLTLRSLRVPMPCHRRLQPCRRDRQDVDAVPASDPLSLRRDLAPLLVAWTDARAFRKSPVRPTGPHRPLDVTSCASRSTVHSPSGLAATNGARMNSRTQQGQADEWRVCATSPPTSHRGGRAPARLERARTAPERLQKYEHPGSRQHQAAERGGEHTHAGVTRMKIAPIGGLERDGEEHRLGVSPTAQGIPGRSRRSYDSLHVCINKHPPCAPAQPARPAGGGGRGSSTPGSRGLLEPRSVDLIGLLGADHPARLVGTFAEALIQRRLHAHRRDRRTSGTATDRSGDLVVPWLYATLEGIGSARALDWLCNEHYAYRWLAGVVGLNPPMPSQPFVSSVPTFWIGSRRSESRHSWPTAP